ncbi:hypothetical protein [Streptomyces sp. NRRL B-24085]|uniref:hypothetical protein n=1 Tax=Streptomyces sp. NRRL B-24085 TaxID=1709476 RepID=UPI00117F9486|nr:hypothetical protein [Streptomyces sp. NRRL B-24085]
MSDRAGRGTTRRAAGGLHRRHPGRAAYDPLPVVAPDVTGATVDAPADLTGPDGSPLPRHRARRYERPVPHDRE